MICFEADIKGIALDFFIKNVGILINYSEANELLKEICGINNFFLSQSDATELSMKILDNDSIVSEDRREYGDFQTNNSLALDVARYAQLKNPNIEFIIEPTCGKGSFIISSLKCFKKIKKIVGVEIYRPYVWETKLNILSFFLDNTTVRIPEIEIYHCDAFNFDFESLAIATKDLNTLVIGNPPWVTNSELGTISSSNLPKKSNFKKHSGFEAITGKGNFDLGEYISLALLKAFQNHNGLFAFLIKNSVVKSLFVSQTLNRFKICNCEMLNIDSKKEFNASVNASLFITKTGSPPEFDCDEFDFYNGDKLTTFGWYKNKFVYSIDDYDSSSVIDGKSPFVWRSGVKHDCSKVMEIENVNDVFKNSLGEEFQLEDELVYGLLKSSDLKEMETNSFRKLTLITQRKVGGDTKYIKDRFPLTYNYLNSHRELFSSRKSSIYIDKPDFSIFGIGEYSFAKFKVAISGLYKSTHFTLVSPNASKPLMLDDTCYFIGFEELKMAQIAQFLLNSSIVQRFLKSIIFSDAKRPINKDNLMRINLHEALNHSDFEAARNVIKDLSKKDWHKFQDLLTPNIPRQGSLF